VESPLQEWHCRLGVLHYSWNRSRSLGGWNWLIVGHSESVPQVSNSPRRGAHHLIRSIKLFRSQSITAVVRRRKSKYASVRVPTCIVIQESTVQDDSGVGVFDNVNLGLRKDILALVALSFSRPARTSL